MRRCSADVKRRAGREMSLISIGGMAGSRFSATSCPSASSRSTPVRSASATAVPSRVRLLIAIPSSTSNVMFPNTYPTWRARPVIKRKWLDVRRGVMKGSRARSLGVTNGLRARWWPGAAMTTRSTGRSRSDRRPPTVPTVVTRAKLTSPVSTSSMTSARVPLSTLTITSGARLRCSISRGVIAS